MRTFVKMSASGLVEASAQAPDDWQGDIADLGDGFVELFTSPDFPKDLGSIWWTGSEWALRLSLPDPVVTEAAGELHYAWSDLPEGAVVTVEDGETGQVLGTEAEVDGAADVELHEAGPYRLTVRAAAAWLAHDIEVVL